MIVGIDTMLELGGVKLKLLALEQVRRSEEGWGGVRRGEEE